MTSLFPGFKQISLLIKDAPEEEGNQRHGNDHDVEQVKCWSTESTRVKHQAVRDDFQADFNGEHGGEEVIEMI